MWGNSQYSNLVYTSLGLSTTFVQFMVKKKWLCILISCFTLLPLGVCRA